MCRDCHDEIEEEYRLHGMLKPIVKKEKIKKYPNYTQDIPLLPFYARKKS